MFIYIFIIIDLEKSRLNKTGKRLNTATKYFTKNTIGHPYLPKIDHNRLTN